MVVVLLLFLIKPLQVLFLSQVRVERDKFLSEFPNQLHLVEQNAIEVSDVAVDVTLRLVDCVQQVHVFARDFNHIVNVLSVTLYQLFFLLKNDLY
jgi:hypothetical protein